MENQPRDFKGIWIPANVWLDNSLTYFEKILLSEIHSLDGKDGCFASNEYLCKFFNERERKIQSGISKLKARGYLYLESFNGRTRVLRTNLTPEKDKSLFSTSATQTAVETEIDKSLFSTSGVSNSAPLTCQKSTSPHYIYNKDREQLQEPAAPAAAVSSKNPENKPPVPREHEKKRGLDYVFDGLNKIDIPGPDKVWLSKHFDEPTINHAIAYATHPQTTINKSLASAIKWACKHKPEIPIDPQEEDRKKQAEKKAAITRNKKHAEEVKKTVTFADNTLFNLYDNRVEIKSPKGCSPLGYTEHGFADQLNLLLRKANARFGKKE